MRRTDREITDTAEMEAIIGRSKICHLAMADGHQPYVVPLSFGYRAKTVYFHSAGSGKKIEMLKRNSRVCLSFVGDHRVAPAEQACDWGYSFESIIVFGTATLVSDPDEKRRALDVIMTHHGAEGPFDYPVSNLKVTTVIRVDIEEMTGKRK